MEALVLQWSLLICLRNRLLILVFISFFIWAFGAGTGVVFLVTHVLVFLLLDLGRSWSWLLGLVVLAPKRLTNHVVLLFLLLHLVLEFWVTWKILVIFAYFLVVLLLWSWLMSNLFTLLIRITTLNTLRNILVSTLMRDILPLCNIIFWFQNLLFTIKFTLTIIILNMMRNRLLHSKSWSAMVDLRLSWLDFWTLSSESLFWNFRVWIIIIIRLNFWFGFRVSLLMVLSELRILLDRFLLIELFIDHVLVDLWIITVSIVTWLLLVSFLSWLSLKLILTGLVLLSINHQLFITINTLFSLVLNLLSLWLLLFGNHVSIFMFLFNNLFRLIHNLLDLNLVALFTLIRVTIDIILIIIPISKLPFNSVIIIGNIIQLLMKVLLWHLVVKCLKFLKFLRHLKNILLLMLDGGIFFWLGGFNDWLFFDLFNFRFNWFSSANLVNDWWFLRDLLHLLSSSLLLAL